MQCNIDQRGRRVRMIGGIICTLAGVICLGLAAAGVAVVPLVCTGIGLLVAGAFQIFEARKGWCAIRAMGFKTPI
ncbi:MAG: hypothetical protein C0478_04995 [Planctomyces sp.]|nr:hypothetical protein [Planctomyces sp.]